MHVIVWSPRLGLSGIVQDGLSEGGRGEKWGRWEGASEGVLQCFEGEVHYYRMYTVCFKSRTELSVYTHSQSTRLECIFILLYVCVYAWGMCRSCVAFESLG